MSPAKAICGTNISSIAISFDKNRKHIKDTPMYRKAVIYVKVFIKSNKL